MWFLTQECDKKIFLKFIERNFLKKNFTKNLFNKLELFIVYLKS